jgi:hypothetical protein
MKIHHNKDGSSTITLSETDKLAFHNEEKSTLMINVNEVKTFMNKVKEDVVLQNNRNPYDGPSFFYVHDEVNEEGRREVRNCLAGFYLINHMGIEPESLSLMEGFDVIDVLENFEREEGLELSTDTAKSFLKVIQLAADNRDVNWRQAIEEVDFDMYNEPKD